MINPPFGLLSEVLSSLLILSHLPEGLFYEPGSFVAFPANKTLRPDGDLSVRTNFNDNLFHDLSPPLNTYAKTDSTVFALLFINTITFPPSGLLSHFDSIKLSKLLDGFANFLPVLTIEVSMERKTAVILLPDCNVMIAARDANNGVALHDCPTPIPGAAGFRTRRGETNIRSPHPGSVERSGFYKLKPKALASTFECLQVLNL